MDKPIVTPVMLYSIGRDNAAMLHVAMNAFYPASLPIPPAARQHAVEIQMNEVFVDPDAIASGPCDSHLVAIGSRSKGWLALMQ